MKPNKVKIRYFDGIGWCIWWDAGREWLLILGFEQPRYLPKTTREPQYQKVWK